MARTIVYYVLGAILFALGLWWWLVVGPSFASIAATIVMGVGGALVVTGLAITLDQVSPSSRKL